MAAAGAYHNVAIRDNGTVLGWGANGGGRAVPENGIFGGKRAVCVSAGEMHSMAVLEDGSVVGWGKHDARLDIPQCDKVRSVSCGGSHTLALLRKGGVIGWGCSKKDSDLPCLRRRAVQVAAGSQHSMALLDNGVVLCWGTITQPDIPMAARVTYIAAGGGHALAILTNGEIYGWGKNDCGQANPPHTDTYPGRPVKVAAGGRHSLALFDDGSVVGWGHKGNGRIAPPVFHSKIVHIAAGGMHSLAVDENKQLHVWGYNGSGQTSVSGGDVFLLPSKPADQKKRAKKAVRPLPPLESRSKVLTIFDLPMRSHTQYQPAHMRALSPREPMLSLPPPKKFYRYDVVPTRNFAVLNTPEPPLFKRLPCLQGDSL